MAICYKYLKKRPAMKFTVKQIDIRKPEYITLLMYLQKACLPGDKPMKVDRGHWWILMPRMENQWDSRVCPDHPNGRTPGICVAPGFCRNTKAMVCRRNSSECESKKPEN
nr:hypothetical protein [uncultured bacterium]